MDKEQRKIVIATIRMRLSIAKDLIVSAAGDVPWCTPAIQRERREALTALSALDLSIEQHGDYIQDKP